MKQYGDFTSECCPRFASLLDIRRFLELPRELVCTAERDYGKRCDTKLSGNDDACPACGAARQEEPIPIVQYSRNRFWGACPLLAGATTIETMHEVLDRQE